MSAEGTLSETPGHKVLSEEQKDLVALSRQVGTAIEEYLGNLEKATSFQTDRRWTAIARTHFQEGLMAAVRSITKPDFF